MTETTKVGSWDDKDFSEGGFFDDKDGTIVESKVVTFDYAGKGDPICALHIGIRPDDAESDDDVRNEYYKIGDITKFTPSSDGEQYIPVGTVSAMNKGAKAALFLRALKDKGFQLTTLAKGVSQLKGLHCHFNNVPMPDVKTADGQVKKDLKVLIVTKIHDTPAPGRTGASDKPAAKRPAKKADAPATTTATAASAGDVNDAAAAKLTEIILGVLAAKDGKAPKTIIAPSVFKEVTDSGLRTECMKLMANLAWLGAGAAERGWDLVDGELRFPS